VFWVISAYFNIRNTLPKFGTFLLGHPVYIYKVANYREMVKHVATSIEEQYYCKALK
jgi:hypothetical protein